jgi:hypothetical protein
MFFEVASDISCGNGDADQFAMIYDDLLFIRIIAKIGTVHSMRHPEQILFKSLGVFF